jgi:hypothetical protein
MAHIDLTTYISHGSRRPFQAQIALIDLHTGLAHALEAVDKTEGVINETVDKIPLAPEE